MRKLVFATVIAFMMLSGKPASAADKDNAPKTKVEQLYQKGLAFSDDGNADSALCYFEKACAVKDAQRDKCYPYVLNQMGILYTTIGDNGRGLACCLKAEGMLKDVEDLELHIDVYNALGVIYRRREMNDSALYYYNKALDSATKHGDKDWLASLSLNLAVFYHNLKHKKDAEHYIDMAVKYVTKTEDEYLNFCCLQLGG